MGTGGGEQDPKGPAEPSGGLCRGLVWSRCAGTAVVHDGAPTMLGGHAHPHLLEPRMCRPGGQSTVSTPVLPIAPYPRSLGLLPWHHGPPPRIPSVARVGVLGWEELPASASCLLVPRKPRDETERPVWEAGPPLPPALWLFTFKMNQGKLPPGQAQCCSKFPEGCQEFEVLCGCGNQLPM